MVYLVIIPGGGQLGHRVWDSGDGFATSRDLIVNTGTAIVVDQTAYIGSLGAILAYLVIAVLLVVRRHRIELPEPA